MDRTIRRSEPTALSSFLAIVVLVILYIYIYYAHIVTPPQIIWFGSRFVAFVMIVAFCAPRILRRSVIIREPQDAASQSRIMTLRWFQRIALIFLMLWMFSITTLMLGDIFVDISKVIIRQLYFISLGAIIIFLVMKIYVVVIYHKICREKGVFQVGSKL